MQSDQFHQNLAPAYGDVNKNSLSTLDDDVQMMIGATAKSLASLSVGNKSYGGVLDNLYRLPFVKPESDESESDTLAGEDADFLKYDGVVE